MAALGVVLLTACPGDDTTQDTEGTTSGTSTEGPDPDGTTSTTTSTTVDPSSSSSTTEAVDETGTSTGGEAGLCEGLTIVGHVGSVLARDGMPIDTTCSPDPVPCGGDLVGDWSLESLCGFEAFPNPFEDMCPGSSLSVEILSQSGTLSFADDGTFVQDYDIELQMTLDFDPMACLGISCDAFEAGLQMDDPTASCQSMGPNCRCTIPDDGMPELGMGTYEVIGNVVVLTVDGESSAGEFCITGDRLDAWQPLVDVPTPTRVTCMDAEDCVDALGDMYDGYTCTPEG
ncbi:hypothetical protein [Paraliomyxa miuraensis]|uniref:hypothetical protein n=1 Tax=Paraliomyxa miuraensis TaxID=376150 RepID=UPI002258EE12|nr:hypothetical protein [Paraliomyxa miuraensis]MCX4241270.1 hypothetical protein [Paraliomyxa miuraensis]